MRSYGRGFVTAVDPYRDNPPDEDGDVVCAGCGAVFPGLDALRAAGLLAYPRRCRECRTGERERAASSAGLLSVPGDPSRVQRSTLAEREAARRRARISAGVRAAKARREAGRS